MNGPVASNLTLLNDLDQIPTGTKVRFLGCVDEYLTKTATLRLVHDYPPSRPPKVAHVDIQHILESIKRHEVDVGTWINVIGHVEPSPKSGTPCICVQAVAVWDAGNVDLDAYQSAVVERKNAGC
ncbi:unnamed protein product [Periconia digitata]|uniref:CST complex subunit Ten1 n=1 Tax=Periconia digitata TaxID=1303443 RepID=A0A9W4U3I5_9PLEO|nr:unnamed protein product [Periconia digitata]